MSKMERYLLGYYREHDGIGTSDEVLLRFVISGATRTMQEMTSADGESEEAVTESLAGIIRKLVG